FGISVQDVKSKKAFAEKNHLTFPLLADTEKKVSAAYGVLSSRGFANRVTFIVGADGRIKNIDRAMRFDRKPEGLQSSHAEALEKALAGRWQAEIGKAVPSFSLPDYDGKPVTSTDTESKLTVVVFLSTQCPVVTDYAARLHQLAETYSAKGVRFLGVNA